MNDVCLRIFGFYIYMYDRCMEYKGSVGPLWGAGLNVHLLENTLGKKTGENPEVLLTHKNLKAMRRESRYHIV